MPKLGVLPANRQLLGARTEFWHPTGAYPFDLSGGARLLVDDADAEDAAAVLSEPPHANRKKQR